MFRFSIRELMLVTMVVALGVGWAIDHWRPNNPYLKAALKNEAMEDKLRIEGFMVSQEGWRVNIRSETDPDKNMVMCIEPEPSP